MSLKHMKTMLGLHNNSMRQSKIDDGRRVMKDKFTLDPSYKDSLVFWEHGKDIIDLSPAHLRLFNEKYSASNGFVIQFSAEYDLPLEIGSVLYDSKKNIYWLCTEVYDRGEILLSGKLTRCNYFLKWQNDNGDIFEYPIFEINSTQYNSGVTENKTTTLGTTQHMVKITADENTIILDHDKRFFFDRNKIKPTVFKLTQNDTTAYNYGKGILNITVMEDEYNENTDSIAEWICNYKPAVTTGNINITYSGKPQIRMGGTYKTFAAESTGTVTWSDSMSAEQKQSVAIVTDGNKYKIKCAFSEKLIGTSFVLKCTDSNGNIGEIEVQMIGGI